MDDHSYTVSWNVGTDPTEQRTMWYITRVEAVEWAMKALFRKVRSLYVWHNDHLVLASSRTF